ncbi:MAG: diguanylate cyclase [Proteobacteria bacterium]|nr:diguanylate cyclase [Pseudomonadota bacterium]
MSSFRNGLRAAAFQWILGLITCCAGFSAGAATHSTSLGSHDPPEIRVLDASITDATISEVASGSLDSRFTGTRIKEQAARGDVLWLRVSTREAFRTGDLPVIVVHAGMLHTIQVFAAGSGQALAPAAKIPEFAGARDTAFLLPASAGANTSAGTVASAAADPAGAITNAAPSAVYVRIAAPGAGYGVPRFAISTLSEFLSEGASRARMITLAFGALGAMAIASLLIWIVLAERAFILYFTLFSLQALYVAYFSGQGFEWPWLSAATPLSHYTWNVISALSGAAACLFVRDIADLRRFMPGAYKVFGWLAGAFMLLTFSNLIKLVGYEDIVNNVGNILFLGSAVYTLVVAFMAWRQGSRSAGWFLVAWTLLEAFTIATTIRLLLNTGEEHDTVIYLGLPLSMVAAALLIALGIADRLRDQRRALSEAERHAQIDSLTGVLNRRSLVERLDAACTRARARGLPISLLFIDLDHFKEINDSFGHQAGDACLAAIIAPIQAELRQSDVIGRYGGEEFVVILSSADTAAAHPIAQRILERVAGVRVTGFGEPIALTCSIGVATSDMLGVWGERLIAQADAAVYQAKRSGRNRVEVAMPLAA